MLLLLTDHPSSGVIHSFSHSFSHLFIHSFIHSWSVSSLAVFSFHCYPFRVSWCMFYRPAPTFIGGFSRILWRIFKDSMKQGSERVLWIIVEDSFKDASREFLWESCWDSCWDSSGILLGLTCCHLKCYSIARVSFMD